MQHHASKAVDVLAFIPHSLGYNPSPNTVVFVSIDDQARSSGILSTSTDDKEPVELAMQAAHTLSDLQPRPMGAFIVGYGGDEGFPVGSLCAGMLMMHGIDPIGIFHVTDEKWIDILEEQEGPLTDIQSSVVAAELVASGSAVGEEYPPIPEPASWEEAKEFWMEVWMDDLLASEVTMRQALSGDGLEAARDEWEQALQRDHGPGHRQAVRLVAFLQNRHIRDRLAVDVLTKTHDSNEFGRALLGEREVPIHKPRWNAAVALLENLLGRTYAEQRIPLLTIQGWLYWIGGRSHLARYHWEAALALDPQDEFPRQLMIYASKNPVPKCATIEPTK